METERQTYHFSFLNALNLAYKTKITNILLRSKLLDICYWLLGRGKLKINGLRH